MSSDRRRENIARREQEGRTDSPYRQRDHRSRSPERRRPRSRSRSPDRQHHSRRSRSPHRRLLNERTRRSRSRSGSPVRRSSRSASPDRRRSHSVSSNSSGDSNDRSRRRKRKDKEERREKRARRKEKKEKRERKKLKMGKSAAVTGQWGQYGIINESDMYNKDAEFRTWLVEECKLNPETLSKDATKKQFAKFVEDYNTATLPHQKFYNMEVYERRMNLIRSGEAIPTETKYDLSADLAAHSSRHKRNPVEQESYLNREQLMELRRVQHERIEAGKMKAMGLEVKTNMGVRMETEYE